MLARWILYVAFVFIGSAPAFAQVRPCPPTGLSAGTESSGSQACTNDDEDWIARSSGPAVFYRNNFDYPDRDTYLDAAHSYNYAESATGQHKLSLETSVKLSGRGASRHNWFSSEGPNERGPAWNYSFDGAGAKTVTTKKTEFYLQYSLYVDHG